MKRHTNQKLKEFEVWRRLPFTPHYMVSNIGRVKSVNIILKQRLNKGGYLTIGLQINRKKKMFLVHRLVAIAFLENEAMRRCVNHKDCIRTNNRVENLEWVTHSENTQHAVNMGNHPIITENARRKGSLISQKKVFRFDTSGNLIDCFNSASEAAKHLNGSSASILGVVHGNRKTAFGFIWSFSDNIPAHHFSLSENRTMKKVINTETGIIHDSVSEVFKTYNLPFKIGLLCQKISRAKKNDTKFEYI